MTRPSGSRLSSLSIGLALFLVVIAFGASAAPPYLGRTVASVLEELAADGLSLVFSSDLVSRELQVLVEPRTDDPLEVARAILAAHGLELQSASGAFLVVRSDAPLVGAIQVELEHSGLGPQSARTRIDLSGPSPQSITTVDSVIDFANLAPGRYEVAAESVLRKSEPVAVELGANETARVLLRLEPVVPSLEELVVGASRYDIVGDLLHSNVSFSRADVEQLSDLGADPVRAVHRLPGTTSGGISAKAHVRGGHDDEMIYVLDGLPLTDPFHARDFQSIFSTIDHRAISSIQVYSGGFPARYGDSLSGVMLIEPRAVDAGLHREIGVSTLSASALTSGTFGGGNGEWLASVRRTTLDLLVDPERARPRFGSVYGRLGIQVGERNTLSLNGLVAEDDILLVEEDDPGRQEKSHSETENGHFWVKLETQWSEAIRSETLLSSVRFTNARHGSRNDPTELVGYVDDVRALDVYGLRQDWTWLPTERHLVNWGVEVRRLSADYRYASSVDLFGFLASYEGAVPSVQRSVAINPKSSNYSLHFSDRVSFGSSLAAEFGLRWDKQTNLPTENLENQISPRLSVLYRIGGNTDLRASWGHFFQSQGLLQLQVEDGVEEFFPAQESRHFIVSLEHRLRNDLVFRLEAYEKAMSNLRPRYENLFDPFALMPELQPYRTRISPASARATGVELLVSNDAAQPLSWWASYALASAKDVESGREIPRSWDQRHALAGGIAWTGGKWTLSAAANYRTGWPITGLSLVPANGPHGEPGVVAVPGERNALRLDSYSRLDFRAERIFDTSSGQLEFFMEITNMLGRQNPCCVRYNLHETPDWTPLLERDVGQWLPLIVSAGVFWEF